MQNVFHSTCEPQIMVFLSSKRFYSLEALDHASICLACNIFSYSTHSDAASEFRATNKQLSMDSIY